MTVKQIVYFLDISLLIYLYVTRAIGCKIQFVSYPFTNSHVSLRSLTLPVFNISFKSILKMRRENSANVCMLESESMSDLSTLMKLSCEFFLDLFFKVFKGAN